MTGEDAAGPRRVVPGRVRRRAVRAVVAAGLVVTAGLAAAATLGLGGTGSGGAAPSRTGPAATATVTRQTLIQSVTLLGEVGYGAAVPLASTASGTLTWLPEVGRVVRRGQALLRADEQPVVLLYGPVPMYRSLAAGLKGADVRQLERNLADLGYPGFTVDDSFTSSTATAVKRWQEDLGLPETGEVEAHRVVFWSGPLRVAQRLARLGGSATGDVLSATGEVRVVSVSAESGEATWATVGVDVTVDLPGGQVSAGRVAAVGPPGAGSGGASGPSGASGGDQAATVEITISLPDQRALDRLERDVRLDAAPARVTHVLSRRADVLTVPVTALLALAEGGYGLEVVTDGGTRIVAVEIGLFADGRVEVSGDGLAEGMTVGVPGA